MTNTPTVNCGLQNGTNCTTCLENVMCYWCDESSVCSNTDFFGLVSTTCPVQDLFITQCVLNGLYSIIVIVAAVLLLVGVFLCICITCCICCCWCRKKKRYFTEDKEQLQMDKLQDYKHEQRMERELKREALRDKYAI